MARLSLDPIACDFCDITLEPHGGVMGPTGWPYVCGEGGVQISELRLRDLRRLLRR